MSKCNGNGHGLSYVAISSKIQQLIVRSGSMRKQAQRIILKSHYIDKDRIIFMCRNKGASIVPTAHYFRHNTPTFLSPDVEARNLSSAHATAFSSVKEFVAGGAVINKQLRNSNWGCFFGWEVKMPQRGMAWQRPRVMARSAVDKQLEALKGGPKLQDLSSCKCLEIACLPSFEFTTCAFERG